MYEHKNGIGLYKAEQRDARFLLNWKADSWTTQHSSVMLTMQDQSEFISRITKSKNDYYLMAMIRHDYDDASLGVVNVSNIDWVSRTADVGMMANASFRGESVVKGLPEAVTDFAFEFLNLNRLQAEVLDNNPAALKFDLDLGYKVEGRKRQAIYKCGKYHDSVMIAMLREEWENSDRVKAYGGVCNSDYKKRKPIDRLLERYERD